MSFTVQHATRSGVKPLIGFYSESGCGKTYSSLLLSRGLAGPGGKVVMVDSEQGRGALYADVLPGGYEIISLAEPFSPGRYIEAIAAAESAGAACVIVDSVSHEWEGPGGILDMAGDNEQRSGKAGLHNWKTPKLEHAKFVQKLLRSTCPLVVCMRAKHKSRQTKNEQGRTQIVKDDYTSPIQADDFIFEATVHGEIMPDHSFRLTKCSHPALRLCFPDGKPIEIHHGEKLAAWCANPSASPKAEVPKESPIATIDDLKRRLWEMTKDQHKGKRANLEAWLINRSVIGEKETLAGLSAERLVGVIEQVETILSDNIP